MSGSRDVSVGDAVEWNWGRGTGRGVVIERFTEDVTREIKGSEITRHADEDQPAYLIEQDDGDLVLKSSTEIEPI